MVSGLRRDVYGGYCDASLGPSPTGELEGWSGPCWGGVESVFGSGGVRGGTGDGVIGGRG